MSFILEVSKTGKDSILFTNHRYRESYTVKSGDVVWRCLGKSCKASIKTNPEKTAIYSSIDTHSGPHPVTMRSLTPTPPHKPRRPVTTTLTTTPTVSNPVADNSASDFTDVTVTSSPSPPALMMEPSATSNLSSPTTMTPTPIEMEAENAKLRDQLTEVKSRLKCVLDHTVESDTRLLKYTDQIFISNQSESDSPKQVLQSDCSVQCEIERNTCTDCQNTRDLVKSLKTTIEVLEAEVKCLKAEKKELEFGGVNSQENKDDWIVYHKKKLPPVHIQNRFSNLREEQPDLPVTAYPTYSKHCHTHTYRKNGDRRRNSRPIQVQKRYNDDPKTIQKTISPLQFTSLQIKGDSHTRHLASVLQDKVNFKTKVSGMCKPRAGIVAASSGKPPPPRTCTVLIAGTNDIAAGNPREIYGNLEEIVTSHLTPSSAVVISTLPTRHDLPAGHPVHTQTAYINQVIVDFCDRYNEVQLLNINCIARRYFTRHGMHLRMAGKRLLAGQIIECMRRAAVGVAQSRRDGSTTSQPTSIATTSLPCQQVASYAETTRTNLPSQTMSTTMTNSINNPVFLGNPLSGLVQN